jgi:CO/xanthine dehydrogenase FAD-binding subunit
MIPFDIDYIRVDSIEEALAAYTDSERNGGTVRFLGGGTELITMARSGRLVFDTVIDLKHIPELLQFEPDGRRFGAAVRLTDLADHRAAEVCPLLALSARGVADRTIRNAITLGGNICGVLPYRETVLPLLLFEASVTTAGPGGVATQPIVGRFDKRLRLDPGEFVVSVELPPGASNAGFYARRTQDSRVDYPLVTICMAETDGAVRLAVGGVFGYPLRCTAAEDRLNDLLGVGQVGRDTVAQAVDGAVQTMIECAGSKPRTDSRASGEYRTELLRQVLTDGVERLRGEDSA